MSRFRTVRVGAALLATGALSLVGLGAPAARAAAAPVSATTMFSTGNQIVASLAVAADGRVFYVGPGTGKIFVWSPKTHKTTTFATMTKAHNGYGVTLSPTFASDHLLYAYADFGDEKLVRYTAKGSVGTAMKVLRDVGPTGTEHAGGKIVFAPNGKNLFLIVGDGGDPANSQDPTIDHGKILRLTPLGAPATGNPGYTDPAIWATGLRNSIGMAFDPATAHLWETENGPECNDEINSISGGKNFGWGPSEVCNGTPGGTNQDGVDPTLPAETINPVVAPVGVTFCAGCGVAGLQGTMVYGQYKTDQLRKVTLDAAHKQIVSDALLYQDSSELLAVESSPATHTIWFADQGGSVKTLH